MTTRLDPKITTPLHPGMTISEHMKSRGWMQSDLARRCGVSAKTISLLLRGKASISPDFSIALEHVLGRPAAFWLNLQAAYDLAIERNQCPHPARNGRHEMYGDSTGMHCRACGRRWPNGDSK